MSANSRQEPRQDESDCWQRSMYVQRMCVQQAQYRHREFV